MDEIAKVFASISEADKIEEFLKSLLTDKELFDISSRWELVKLLDQGMSQRHIARELQVSLCKITRGSKELKKDDSIFKYFIDRHYKQNGQKE